MIYLISGTDTSRIKERVSRLVGSSTQENADVVQYSTNFDVQKIIGDASQVSFFGGRKVIILKGILQSKDKEALAILANWLDGCPADTVLIFVEEGTVDQRLAIVKKLNSIATVENYQPLTANEILRYIEKTVTESGGSIDGPATSLLGMYLGNDLDRIKNEVDKLIAYDPTITSENVTLLVDAGYFNTIFELTDSIAAKNKKKALYNLDKLLESGESEIYLLTMLAMQVRNLLLIKDLKNHQLTESEIVARSKLHPYVVKKAIGQIQNFTVDQLLTMHKGLLELDTEFKGSSYDPKALLTTYLLQSLV